MADGVAVGSGTLVNTISSDAIKGSHAAQDTLGPAALHFSGYKEQFEIESHRSTSKFQPLIADKQFELRELGAIFEKSKDTKELQDEEMIGSPPMEIHASLYKMMD